MFTSTHRSTTSDPETSPVEQTHRREPMRVLVTTQPAIGHLHPLVPVAGALGDAGHEVAVCTAPSFRGNVEAFGLTHAVCS
jgi:hypothetical protein